MAADRKRWRPQTIPLVPRSTACFDLQRKVGEQINIVLLPQCANRSAIAVPNIVAPAGITDGGMNRTGTFPKPAQEEGHFTADGSSASAGNHHRPLASSIGSTISGIEPRHGWLESAGIVAHRHFV